jgi:predicted transcriptional regulator
MADEFDFGFSAVSTEEFSKTQTVTETQPSAVSSEEFGELKKKLDSISSLIQTLGDREDTSLFDETGEIVAANGEKISRVEDKVDKILAMESSQVASALEEQGSSIRAVIDEVEERKGELNEKFSGKLKELESLVIPMLKGLMKNAEKEYIYWPDRTPILEKQIKKVYSITRPE